MVLNARGARVSHKILAYTSALLALASPEATFSPIGRPCKSTRQRVHSLPMTVGEAAKHLGLSPATLRRQIANGRMTATKLGRDWDIAADEVARYRAESRGRPGRRRLQPTLGLIDS